MTAQPPRPSVPRSSFAAALKDYTFIRPGIAVSISAACLIAAVIIGVFLIGSLKRATVIKGLQAGNVGLNEAGRQAMVVVLARQDEAMLEAVGVSQRAVLLSAVLIALTVVAAGTLVVPMAWLYIRFKRGALIRVAA